MTITGSTPATAETATAAGARTGGIGVESELFVSAGEPSGDGMGREVVDRLVEGGWHGRLWGMGGPRLRQVAGADLYPMERLSTIGFAEILTRIPAHVGEWARVRRVQRARPASAAVLIDYPGYHLRLAPTFRRTGTPVLIYVAPQLWAWGAGRMGRLRGAADHLAVILPFEAAFFARAGIPTTFVGHPLLDQPPPPDRHDARRQLGLGSGPVVAMFPGSRPGEVARLWPRFRAVAARLRKAVPDLQVVLTDVPGLAYPGDHGVIRAASSALALRAADAALLKSGTVTLEAARCGTPGVIAYRMHPVTHWMARRLIRCEHIGLVNLLAGRRALPEYVQDDAAVPVLVNALLALLEGRGVADQRAAQEEAIAALGPPGAAARVGALVAEMSGIGS